MTERWEEQLKHLERVEAPLSIQARFEQGPKGDAGDQDSVSPVRRFAIIATSLAIGLAAIAWVVLAIRPTTSPPIIADQPILSPAPKSDCPTGLVRENPVQTPEFVDLMSGYLPTWMPEGFGLLATYGQVDTPTYGPAGLLKTFGHGIWSDEACREVELQFAPGSMSLEDDLVGVRPGDLRESVGPWVVRADVPDGCANAVLGEARCLRYSASTPGGLLSLSMMGLDRDDGDRIALSIYSGEPFYFPTAESGPLQMAALIQGPLLERDGCLFVDGGDLETLPIWPEGYTVAPASSGALQVIDANGAPVALVGGQVSMSGGYVAEFFPPDKVDPRDAQIASVEDRFGLSIPTRCLGPDVYGIWLVGSTDVAEPTTSPHSQPAEESFIPPTTTQGSTTTLPLVFPDGSRAVVAYPEPLGLADLVLTPQTLVHSTQSNGCGWDPIIRFGDASDLYQGDSPVSTPPEGGPAMWEAKGGGSAYYLVYEFGDWTVNVPCERSDFDGRDAWNDGLQAHVTPDGFLVLDTSPPIVQEGADPDLSQGPGFIFGGADDPGFVVLTLGTRCDSGTGLQRDNDSAQWCVAIGDGAVEITVYALNTNPAGRQFIDSVADGLEIRSIDVSQ